MSVARVAAERMAENRLADVVVAAPEAAYVPDVLLHLFIFLRERHAEEAAPVCWAWARAFANAREWSGNLASAAEHEKESGNERFRAGDTKAAINYYTAAIQSLAQSNDWSTVTPDANLELELTCLSNRAACYLKNDDIFLAVEDTAAAVFDGRLQLARIALRGVAVKAALRLSEAAERAESKRREADGVEIGDAKLNDALSSLVSLSNRFGSAAMAKRV